VAYSSERAFTCIIEGITGPWASADQVEYDRDAKEVYDGISPWPTKLAGPIKLGKFKVKRPYDADRDEPILSDHMRRSSTFRTTMNVQPVDDDGIAIGAPRRYRGVLTGLKTPQFDANSSDVAMIEAEFELEQVL
jgi:hypothetical protein